MLATSSWIARFEMTRELVTKQIPRLRDKYNIYKFTCKSVTSTLCQILPLVISCKEASTARAEMWRRDMTPTFSSASTRRQHCRQLSDDSQDAMQKSFVIQSTSDATRVISHMRHHLSANWCFAQICGDWWRRLFRANAQSSGNIIYIYMFGQYDKAG